MSYVSSLFHIVFATYQRHNGLDLDCRDELFAIIGNEITRLKSKPLIIGGMSDHIHILVSLHPTVALSDLVRDIKTKSSYWMKHSGKFRFFDGWEKEYGAFSLSATHKGAVYNYIRNQQIHHLQVKTEDEFRRLVDKAGLTFYEG